VNTQQFEHSPAERRRMARQHIFVVNGAPPVLELLRELFQGESYNVTTTNFVPETFDQIAALTPDLLMVDVVAGDQAGWHLLERLNGEAATRGIPVIIFSTSPALLDRARDLAMTDGASRVLAKPFDLDALLALVEELIGPA
jgi:CheY-like chemotaxis protein